MVGNPSSDSDPPDGRLLVEENIVSEGTVFVNGAISPIEVYHPQNKAPWIEEQFSYVHQGGGAYITDADSGVFVVAKGYEGPASSHGGVISFWFYCDENPATSTVYVWESSKDDNTTYNRVTIDSAGTVRWTMYADGSNSNVVYELVSNAGAITRPGSTWQHVAMSFWNAPTFEYAHLYVDGVDALNTGASTLAYDATGMSWQYDRATFLGCRAGIPGAAIPGSAFAHLIVKDQTYIDLSIPANLEMFRTSDGKPEDMGEDGSTAVGSKPLHYFRRMGWYMGLNRGYGGDTSWHGLIGFPPGTKLEV